jgi:orotidine-5'-phosphate decarboxylase
MVRAAKETGLYVIAVTLLTSLDDDEILKLYKAPPEEVVPILADWALAGEADALVCSPKQVETLHAWRQKLDQSVWPKHAWPRLIVPGTRSPGTATHDQKQVDTPYHTILNGADYLVIGRQATESEDPVHALAQIKAEIAPAIAERIRQNTWLD